jgi:hypothetical protein
MRIVWVGCEGNGEGVSAGVQGQGCGTDLDFVVAVSQAIQGRFQCVECALDHFSLLGLEPDFTEELVDLKLKEV